MSARDYEIRCSRDLALRLGALCPIDPRNYRELAANIGFGRYVVMRDWDGRALFWPLHQLEETSS